MLEPVRVLTISAVGGTAGRLYIGHSPWLRTQRPEKGRRMKGSGPHLGIIGLLNHTPLIRPESFQSKYQFLIIHHAPTIRPLILPLSHQGEKAENGLALSRLECQPGTNSPYPSLLKGGDGGMRDNVFSDFNSFPNW